MIGMARRRGATYTTRPEPTKSRSATSAFSEMTWLLEHKCGRWCCVAHADQRNIR
jgi:hypothetical protein